LMKLMAIISLVFAEFFYKTGYIGKYIDWNFCYYKFKFNNTRIFNLVLYYFINIKCIINVELYIIIKVNKYFN
jgi:hypothetical protein